MFPVETYEIEGMNVVMLTSGRRGFPARCAIHKTHLGFFSAELVILGAPRLDIEPVSCPECIANHVAALEALSAERDGISTMVGAE